MDSVKELLDALGEEEEWFEKKSTKTFSSTDKLSLDICDIHNVCVLQGTTPDLTITLRIKNVPNRTVAFCEYMLSHTTVCMNDNDEVYKDTWAYIELPMLGSDNKGALKILDCVYVSIDGAALTSIGLELEGIEDALFISDSSFKYIEASKMLADGVINDSSVGNLKYRGRMLAVRDTTFTLGVEVKTSRNIEFTNVTGKDGTTILCQSKKGKIRFNNVQSSGMSCETMEEVARADGVTLTNCKGKVVSARCKGVGHIIMIDTTGSEQLSAHLFTGGLHGKGPQKPTVFKTRSAPPDQFVLTA